MTKKLTKKLTTNLASALRWIAKILAAPSRGRNLQRPWHLGREFSLVAPLGGGAIVAFQALHLPGGDDGSLLAAQPRRGRSPWAYAV
jgi:hypothetical protein